LEDETVRLDKTFACTVAFVAKFSLLRTHAENSKSP
jgi:hypothetical protein